MLEADKVIYRRAAIIAAILCVLVVASYFLFLRDLPFYSFNGAPVAAESTDYVGTWEGNNMELIVQKFGRVHFQHKQGNYTGTLDMPLQKITPQAISVGAAFWTTDITVQTPPHQQDGKWHMTVENTDLTRKD